MRIVIIGGGILGASAAYHLAKENHEVIIIDQQDKGQATAAGAGIICPWASLDREETWYRMANAAAHYYPGFVEALKADGANNISYKKVGTLITAEEAALLEEYHALLEKRREEAPLLGKVEALSPTEAKALFPPLGDDLHALYIEGGARVDGRLLTAAILEACQKVGVKLIQGYGRLHIEDGLARGVMLGEDLYEADRVLLTTGAWVNDLLKDFNIRLPIQPQRGQIVHLQMPEAKTEEWPIISPVNSGHYIVSFEGEKVVLGATRESGAGFDYRKTAGGIAEVLREGLKVAPGLAQASLDEIRIGFRPFSDDLLPVIGPLPAIEQLYLANGLGPSGLTLGPYVGHLISNLILEKENPIDLSSFRVTYESIDSKK